jgi:hypothetical protein
MKSNRVKFQGETLVCDIAFLFKSQIKFGNEFSRMPVHKNKQTNQKPVFEKQNLFSWMFI